MSVAVTALPLSLIVTTPVCVLPAVKLPAKAAAVFAADPLSATVLLSR